MEDLQKQDRLPPHSEEAEQGVLGCIFLDPYEVIDECITKFGPSGSSVFYNLRNRTIYECILDMHNKLEAIDLITVHSRLAKKGVIDSVGGVSYLASLPDTVPSAANLPFYVNIVIEKHVLRTMVRGLAQSAEEIHTHDGEVGELLSKIESRILSVTDISTNRDLAPQCRAVTIAAIAQFEAEFTSDGSLTGIPTGMPDLDRMTGGLRAGEMIVLAARPSMGKTSLGMQICESVAVDQKIPVGVFSLEMNAQSLIERMVCSRARVNRRSIPAKSITDRDFQTLSMAAKEISNAPLFIDDSAGLNIDEVRSRARRMHKKYGVKLFVIDYLQLMGGTNKDKGKNREREVADISSGVKNIARELGVPVIVMAQLNREIERDKNRKPRMSDLRESGAIEQDADVIGFLYKAGSEDDDSPDHCPANLLIAKQRNGGTGDIHMLFRKTITRFEPMAREDHSPEPQ